MEQKQQPAPTNPRGKDFTTNGVYDLASCIHSVLITPFP